MAPMYLSEENCSSLVSKISTIGNNALRPEIGIDLLIWLSWLKRTIVPISVSKSSNRHLKGNRAKIMGCKAINCMRVFARKRETFMSYWRDHCFSGTTIKKELKYPVSGCFTSYVRQSLWNARNKNTILNSDIRCSKNLLKISFEETSAYNLSRWEEKLTPNSQISTLFRIILSIAMPPLVQQYNVCHLYG